jgi:predicted  nucleic acid-binding Zn-ribbon protein
MSLETAKAEMQQEADKINNRLQDKEKQLANLKQHYLTLENSIEQRIENKVSQLLSKVFAS